NCYNLAIKKADGLLKENGNTTVFNQSSLSIYPNPASDEVTIYTISDEDKNSGIRITDLIGRVVFEQPIVLHSGENEFTINIQNLITGTYFIKVLNTDLPVQKLMVNGE
ncbi:MAG TPA: T9SS type A sorting domain-containing protein, partial [Chitinophagales bacterium]|nr:T9SS type A sorting domain-containing protein [Chitinophagales bacterium]